MANFAKIINTLQFTGNKQKNMLNIARCVLKQQEQNMAKVFLETFANYKPCPFDLGLRKFALDSAVVIFFKKCQKN